jgi:hypothetical protein
MDEGYGKQHDERTRDHGCSSTKCDKKDRAAGGSVISSQAQTPDTMVSALAQLSAAVEDQGGDSDSGARLASVRGRR